MATFCDGIVQNIERTECIGNSLVKINSNFSGLEAAGCNLEGEISQLTTLITTLTALQTSYIGGVSYFPSTIAPTGWLALSGQTLSRSEYSGLWTFAQSSGNIVTDAQWTSLSAYGAFTTGDLSTTFRIPDLRGHFVRGSGTHTDGTAAGTFGVKQIDAIVQHGHTLTQGGTTPSKLSQVDAGVGNGSGTMAFNAAWNYNYASSFRSWPTFDTITGALTANETRPKNIALLACIKY